MTMPLDLSCAFATSLDTPAHVAVAERLGYRRAWLYDSPALYPDVWAQLCRAADRTDRIGLGPGVLVPSLRHPLANASAIATLVDAAGPGRVAVAVGAGFTGRMAMGRRAMAWKDVAEYVRTLRALLRGEDATWEGAAIRMLHREEFAPRRPIDVPFVIAAAGPKGIAVARELGDGVFGAPAPVPGFAWSVVLTFGTILRPGVSRRGTRRRRRRTRRRRVVPLGPRARPARPRAGWREMGARIRGDSGAHPPSGAPRGAPLRGEQGRSPVRARRLPGERRRCTGCGGLAREDRPARGGRRDGDRLPARGAGHPGRARGVRRTHGRGGGAASRRAFASARSAAKAVS